jgi:Na+/glutamate symporter
MINSIPCFYCGTSIDITPESVRRMQAFTKKYGADDSCVACQSKFVHAYVEAYEKLTEETQGKVAEVIAACLSAVKK